jgi:hypothetical protein
MRINCALGRINLQAHRLDEAFALEQLGERSAVIGITAHVPDFFYASPKQEKDNANAQSSIGDH